MIRFGALWSHLNKKSCRDEKPVLESDSETEWAKQAKGIIHDWAKKEKRERRQEPLQGRERGCRHRCSPPGACSRTRDGPGNCGYIQKGREDGPRHYESGAGTEGQGKAPATKVQTALGSAAQRRAL